MKDFISNPERKKAINALTTEEQKTVKAVMEELKLFIKKPAITEAGYQSLNNSFRQLDIFRENYTNRYIRLLKQGNIIG